MVTEEACLCIGLDNWSAKLCDEGSAHLRCECLEGLHHVGVIPVDVQVIRIYCRDHRNLRVELKEGPVKLIGLRYHGIGLGHQEIGSVVTGNTAQEGAAAFAAGGENMRCKGAGGGFPVGSGNRKAPLALGDLSKGAGALEKGVSAFAGLHHFPKVLGHRRRINHQGLVYVGGDEVRTVLVVDGYPFRLKLPRELRRRAVIPRHVEALELVVPGQRGHSNSAYTYEIYVFHTNL